MNDRSTIMVRAQRLPIPAPTDQEGQAAGSAWVIARRSLAVRQLTPTGTSGAAESTLSSRFTRVPFTCSTVRSERPTSLATSSTRMPSALSRRTADAVQPSGGRPLQPPRIESTQRRWPARIVARILWVRHPKWAIEPYSTADPRRTLVMRSGGSQAERVAGPPTGVARGPTAGAEQSDKERYHVKSNSMRFPVVILLGLVAAISAACSSNTSSATPFAGKTPAQVLAMAHAAALAKGSQHWVEDVKIGSGTSLQFVTDAGTPQGKQTITGTSGTGTVLLVSAQMAYAKGDATFLEQNLQVPSDEASTYAGRWIAVPSSSPSFGGLTLGLTVPPLLPREAPSAPLRLTKLTTIDGKSVMGVTGGFDTSEAAEGWVGTQVLYISTVAPYVSIAMTQHGTMAGGATITDSNHTSDYGESVVVTAPSGSIPISSIPGTS